MITTIANQWVSRDVLRRASAINLAVLVERMEWASNPLNKKNMVYVADDRSPRAVKDCHYQDAMDYTKLSVATFAARHAKEYGLDFRDMLCYPVFISHYRHIDYSTDRHKKDFGGFVYQKAP